MKLRKKGRDKQWFSNWDFYGVFNFYFEADGLCSETRKSESYSIVCMYHFMALRLFP